MNILRKVVVITLCLLFLSACGGLTSSNTPANQTWWLTPYDAAAHRVTAEAPSPVVIVVSVVPGLDTNRILTLSHDAQLNRYESARWPENLPELFQSLVGRTLESSGRFEVVSGRTGIESEICDLQLQVTGFFAELGIDGKTTGVRVAVDGLFRCGPGDAVPLQLSALEAVSDDRMSLIVAAFQRAVNDTMAKLLKSIQGY